MPRCVRQHCQTQRLLWPSVEGSPLLADRSPRIGGAALALSDLTGREILLATEEYDRLGRNAFLGTYGFAPARSYLLLLNGKTYDSKAIAGVAHGYLPGQRPLKASNFSGGAATVGRLLRGLGFEVTAASDKGSSDPSPSLAISALLDSLARLRLYRSPTGRQALYQPLTLAWAIGRAYRGVGRITPWSETKHALGGFLERHGEYPRPHYPLAALYYAGLWEIDGLRQVPPAHRNLPGRWFSEPSSAKRPYRALLQPRSLVRRGPRRRRRGHGGRVPNGRGRGYGLGRDPHRRGPGGRRDRRRSCASKRRDDNALGQPHRGGIPPPVRDRGSYARTRSEPAPSPRDLRPDALPIGRRAVLKRSEGHCENPSSTGDPQDITDAGHPILEIDHVHDLAKGGPDHPEQMVALCPNCHAIKTRGRTREKLRLELLTVALHRHNALLTQAVL